MKAEYVDHMGTDLSPVNAARVSFDKISEGFKYVVLDDNHPDGYRIEIGTTHDDEKLIKYLAKHDHWTPFAHTAITLRIQAPISIRTQCFKHKVGFVENEESRRYIFTAPELFIPKEFRNKPEGSIKQGSGSTHTDSDFWLWVYKLMGKIQIKLYNNMIKKGVCPEQARFILPQGVEVNWMWTGNLMSFARFYNQRTDPHAQKEIQELAHMVGEIIKPLFPVSWKVLTE